MEKMELMEELKKYAATKKGDHITGPKTVYEALLDKTLIDHEEFYAISVDGQHHITKIHTVTTGLVNRTLVHPREIFRNAIIDNAVAIIVAHNHPSGSLDPSTEDKQITKSISDASKIIGIDLLDHVIISKEGFYSFLEHGDL